MFHGTFFVDLVQPDLRTPELFFRICISEKYTQIFERNKMKHKCSLSINQI